MLFQQDVVILLIAASVEKYALHHCVCFISSAITGIIPQFSKVWLDWFHAKECHSHEYRPAGPIQSKGKRKRFCAAGSCVITGLNAAPSLSVVLNLQPVPEVCCRLRSPMKEYRLVVIGSVTVECTQQQMRNRKKMLWGLKCHVNSWVQPLNTSGVISTPFNAFKGQGFV